MAAIHLNPTRSMEALGRVEGVDVADNLLVVATSNLGGNSWDSSLHVMDINTLEVVTSVNKSCGSADVCWMGGGRSAVCAEDSGDVKVLKMEEAPARLVEVATLREHDDIVSSVATARGHDGFVLSGSHDRSIKIWDIGGGTSASLGTFTGHSAEITSVAWKIREGEQQFASASLDCSVRMWDSRQRQRCRACHRLSFPALTISWEDSQTVLAVENNISRDRAERSFVPTGHGHIPTLINPRRRRVVHLVSGEVLHVHKGRVNRVRASRCTSGDGSSQDSSMLASVGDDGVLVVQKMSDSSSYQRSLLHSDYVRALAWNGESELITGGWDMALRVVQVRTVGSESIQK